MKKRIALSVVAALAGGLLAAVPASAAVTVSLMPASLTAGSPAVLTNPGVVNTGDPLTMSALSSADATAIKGIVTSAPAGATGSLALGTTFAFTNGGSYVWTATAASGSTAGAYSVRIYDDANSNGVWDSAEATTTYSVKVGGAISKVTITPATGGTLIQGQTVSYAVAFADSSSNATLPTLAGTSTYTLADAAATAVYSTNLKFINGTANGANTNNWTNQTGWSYVPATGKFVRAAAAISGTATVGDHVITVTSSGTAPTGSVTHAVVANAGGTLTVQPGQTGVYAASPYTAIDADVARTSIAFGVSGATAGGRTLVSYAAAAGYLDGGLATGQAQVLIGADGKGTFVLTVPAPAANVVVTLAQGTSATGAGFSTVTYFVPAPSIAFDLSGAATAAYNAKAGDSGTIIGYVSDLIGRPYASKSVLVSVSGRNPASASLTTDADGMFKYTLKDVNTSTDFTTYGTDTVTFTTMDGTTAVTGTVTVTYSATGQVVGTVTVTNANGAATKAIDTDGNPATKTDRVTYTATVRDASGLPLKGVPVTFAGGADDLFVGGVNSGITNTNGTVSVLVYRNKTGVAAVKATANGVVGTDSTVTWVNAATDARNLALAFSPAETVAGGVLNAVATVTDRFGNPVAGVTVTFTQTGAGRFVAAQANPVVTNIAGQAQIQVSSLSTETGSITVGASMTSAGNQAGDVAGYVGAFPVTGVTAGNYAITATGKFNAASAVADPTITALVTQVQSLIVSVNAIIASMTRSIAATNTQIAKLVAAIAKLTKK